MNTRLQVEHPITECITGVDLVHQMIRSAYGHPLRLSQDDIQIRGWAVENRVYAEDPFKNFGMPSIGRLYKYEEPKSLSGVRCDSGIEEGSEISMYYDPMICKLTTYADTREEAIKKSVNALDHYVIRGVTHNIPLLRDILTETKFNEGNFTTNYLPETYPDGFQGVQLTPDESLELAVIASAMHSKEANRARQTLNNYVIKNEESNLDEFDLMVTVKGEDIPVHMTRDGARFVAKSGGKTLALLDNFQLSDSVVKATFDEKVSVVQLIGRQADGTLRIRYKGTALNVPVIPAHAAELRKYMKEKPKLDLSKVILSPMPGVVKAISVEIGQMVGEGLECCVVEAMKMQNSMKASATGKVKAINIKVGDTVEEDQVLIELE
ncbi:hypothetical protein TCAL_10366 [Tigriopus californicus]|uniref:Uncharacterized protein n=2 Tax=Tigriopus californicus TaxID=6832 RepID=A0A553PHX5_TIGCA|nr:hypothetical protein TCAL_10366 [Tigriopus californicus]